MRNWTDSKKAKQAKLIHNWRPWLKAGVKSETGKMASRMNALKHGDFSAITRAEKRIAKKMIKKCRNVLNEIT